MSQELASKALNSRPEEKRSPPFLGIKQSPTEGFPEFINRLHAAVDAFPDFKEETEVQMLALLAFQNANEKTKSVLSVLPKGSTTAQTLELADRTLSQTQTTATAAAVGAVVKPLLGTNNQKEERRCYSCGKTGHFI